MMLFVLSSLMELINGKQITIARFLNTVNSCFPSAIFSQTLDLWAHKGQTAILLNSSFDKNM